MEVLLITFLASFLIWFMFFGLVVHWFIDGKIKKEQAFHAFLSALIAWAVSEMMAVFPHSTRRRPLLSALHSGCTTVKSVSCTFWLRLESE